MAQIIRKLEKGNQIKKYQNSDGPIQKQQQGITIQDLQSSQTQPTTVNSSTTNLNNTGITVNDLQSSNNTQPKFFVNGGDYKDWNADKISQAIRRAIQENKQIKNEEGFAALDKLMGIISSGKEIHFKNGELLVDGKNINTIRNDYNTGFDGYLARRQVESYVNHLLQQYVGAVKYDNQDNYDQTMPNYGLDYGSNYKAPVLPPSYNFTIPEQQSTEQEYEEDVEKTIPEQDEEVRRAFVRNYGTDLVSNDVDYLSNQGIYRYSTGNPNEYLLIKKNTDGQYELYNNNFLQHDKTTQQDYGSAYIRKNPNEYFHQLINDDNLINFDDFTKKHYLELKSKINKAVNEYQKRVQTNYQNKNYYHTVINPYTVHKPQDKPVYNVSGFFQNPKGLEIYTQTFNPDILGRPFKYREQDDNTSVYINTKDGVKPAIIFRKDNQYYVKFQDDNPPIPLGYYEDPKTINNNEYEQFIFNSITPTATYEKFEGDVNLALNLLTRLYKDYDINPNDVNKGFYQMRDYFQENEKKMSSEQQDIFKILLNNLAKKINSEQNQQQIPSHQQGGSLEQYLNALANYKTLENPTQEQIVVNTTQGTPREEATIGNVSSWDLRDWARGGATALDAVSLTGGAVGVGAGLMATLAEGIADFTDDSISKSDAALNLVTNLGFTLLAVIPGLASTKIAKSATKGGVKLAKTLSKLENVANKSKDITDITQKASKNITYKDAKNITNAVSDFIKNSNVSDADKKIAQEVLDVCQDFLKTGQNSKALNIVSNATNLGFTTIGGIAGFSALSDVKDKITSGNADDISLADARGLVAGLGAVKGAKQTFRNYAIKKGITDKTSTVTSEPTNSRKDIELEIDGKKFTVNSNSDEAKDVKFALKKQIDDFDAKKAKLKKDLDSAVDENKASIQKKINDIDAEIKLRKSVQEDFDNIYKKPGRGKQFVESAKNKANSFKNFFKVSEYDYSNKKLIDDANDLSWVQKKGRQYAKEEGFTEDGFSIENSPLSSNKDWYDLKNQHKKYLAEKNSKKSPTEKSGAENKPSGETSTESPSTTLSSPENTTSGTTPSATSKPAESSSSSGTELSVPKGSTPTSQAIDKIHKLKNKLFLFDSKDNIKSVLRNLKKLSNNLTNDDKEQIKSFVFNKKWYKELKPKDKTYIENLLMSLKNGGLINKHQSGASIGDASNSVKSPIDDSKEKKKKEEKKKEETKNEEVPFYLQKSLGPKITEKKYNWAILPEALSQSAKALNATLTTNKVYDIQQDIDNKKVQYPYLHQVVKEDLAGIKNYQDKLNENRSFLNQNLSSDNFLNKATSLEFIKSNIKGQNELNAQRSTNLTNQEQRALDQEDKNRVNETNANNQNIESDVELSKYKKILEASRHNNLGQIRNAFLDQRWQLVNKLMNLAKQRQLMVDKSQLGIDYINNSQGYSNWLLKNDTFEASEYSNMAKVLNIDKDVSLTQEHINTLLDNYKRTNPNVTEQNIKEITEDLNSMIGKSLNQVWQNRYDLYNNYYNYLTRRYSIDSQLMDSNYLAGSPYLTPHTFDGFSFTRYKEGGTIPYLKNGNSFKSVKYKTDASERMQHNKLFLEYQKLMHKQHQEAMKSIKPFLLHSYKKF